jgi:hypothetical protein
MKYTESPKTSSENGYLHVHCYNVNILTTRNHQSVLMMHDSDKLRRKNNPNAPVPEQLHEDTPACINGVCHSCMTLFLLLHIFAESLL